MAISGKILVTGATGNVGSVLISNLTAMGAQVRALTRNESSAQGLRDVGVEVVIGDLDQPETLNEAFSGADHVFLLTAPSPRAVTQATNGIAAARRAGSPHIVRMAAWKPTLDSPARIARQHAEITDELKRSSLPYTILQPHFFMQNTLMAADTVASGCPGCEHGMVYMPFKDGKVGMIDVRDIGDAAAKVLTTAGHEGKTYELTGPASISFHDVAATLSRVLGKEVIYVDVPLEAAKESMVGMGIPEWFADGLNEFFDIFSKGGGDAVTDDLRELVGHSPRSFETFARDFAQAFSVPAGQST